MPDIAKRVSVSRQAAYINIENRAELLGEVTSDVDCALGVEARDAEAARAWSARMQAAAHGTFLAEP